MKAIGGAHRLETAVADLVDNSIHAEASLVLLRFVIADGQVRCFYVVDNGRGMFRPQIDAAMTVGGVRAYGPAELGHFGLGLKAASLSQADSLTVISVAMDTPVVGRRWVTSHGRGSFECDVVGSGLCSRELRRPRSLLVPDPTGTVVRWDGPRAFDGAHDSASTTRFIQDATVRLAVDRGTACGSVRRPPYRCSRVSQGADHGWERTCPELALGNRSGAIVTSSRRGAR